MSRNSYRFDQISLALFKFLFFYEEDFVKFIDFRMYEAYVQSSTLMMCIFRENTSLYATAFFFFASIWKRIQNYEINYINEKYAS